jgi:hypothetical protein
MYDVLSEWKPFPEWKTRRVLCPQKTADVVSQKTRAFRPGARRKEATVITDRLAFQSWNAKPFSRLFFYLPRILKRMDGNIASSTTASIQQSAKEIPLQQNEKYRVASASKTRVEGYRWRSLGKCRVERSTLCVVNAS